MWIKRDSIIINTDNVCSMQQSGDKLIFRLHGASTSSTIDRAALSAEITMKKVSEGTLDVIWQAISNGDNYLILK
jgi:hypothetical protein